MTGPGPFSLSKWYLDCVGDDGRVLVGYAATLRFRRARVHYTSVLTSDAAGAGRERRSLRAVAPPEVTPSAVVWTSRSPAIEGRWTRRAPAFETTLLDTEGGAVRWNCVLPSGDAEVAVEGGAPARGLGYVEHLDLSLPPWRLPIRELRWGRFLTPTDSLVWIDWRGDRPLTLVLVDGKPAPGGTVSDDAIATDGGRSVLTLADRRVLREGPLLSTALAGIPGIERWAPGRILRTREHKWISRGTLSRPDAPPVTGWALHEQVVFA